MRCIERAARGAVAVLTVALLAPGASADSGLGYASVGAARAALEARPDVLVERDAGWTVYVDSFAPTHTTWSFAPASEAAFPAVIRRDLEQRGGVPTLVTRFVCEGQRGACEALYARLRAAGDGRGHDGAGVP